jgi:hypothetical protein
MKKITIILPIYKLEEDDIIMLKNALFSVEDFHNDVKITIVCPERLKVKLDSFDFGQKLEVKLLYNPTYDTDFMSQINLGITDCDTEWFSILEIDDEYKKIWLSSMYEYMEAFKDVDVFLPIVKDIDPEGKFTNFTNETVWAFGFTNKQGYLDNELLLEYQNYQTSGGLYRTQVIRNNGSFKNNIKLTFSYEFLLRLTYNGVNIMCVPKIGYQHVNLRENSLFWAYKNDDNEKLSQEEVKFWLETAKKEYYFKNKRDVKYLKE